MYSTKNTPSVYEIIEYSMPKLHEGQKWYVDFYQIDPATKKLKRKKYHIDSCGSVRNKRKRANELIACISERLKSGWNVWANVEQSREYTLITDAFDLYKKVTERLVKTKSLKEKTGYGYLSFMEIFETWVKNRAQKLTYCYQLDITIYSDFLDYILITRQSSARTRNNYRGWLSTFCKWMVEKGFMHDNPIEKIRTMKEEKKYRDAIDGNDLTKLSNYLEKKNPNFLLACMMEYYTFIRPGELSSIKLENIRIAEQKIFVSASISKNRRDGMVAINDRLIKMMLDLHVFDQPNHYYLFGKDFRPSDKKADSRIFREYFAKVRKALKWGDEKQFYSLKDSGIRDLANAEGIVIARDQARHTDVATTNKYLKGEDLAVHEQTKHFKGAL